MIELNMPLSKLYGVGPRTGHRLQKLGLETVIDLIYHFPARYEDFSRVLPISKVRPNETVTLRGKILSISNSRSPRRRMSVTNAILSDSSGSIQVVWFNQPFLAKTLPSGSQVILAGEVKYGYHGYQLVSPAYEKVSSDTVHVARIVPVYPETEGLSSKWLRAKIKPLLKLVKNISDFLPEQIKKDYDLVGLSEALFQIHFPGSWSEQEKARKRLAFDELFLIQLKTQRLRADLEKYQAPALRFDEKLVKSLVISLPFKLTGAQRKAAWQIILSLDKKIPMNRLLEGDVGSGKTVVAAIAMLLCARRHYQSLIMAPTEVLAMQHFKTLRKTLADFKIKIALVTSSKKELASRGRKTKVSSRALYVKIKKGEVDIAIGTHALISEKIEYKKIGLVVVDEQHRFGVRQRALLKKKSNLDKKSLPHLLSMTATPIPRTLSLAFYGDLDISRLDEMPPGRQKIITRLIPPQKRSQAYQFIDKEIGSSGQVFVICPLISESEKLQVKAAEVEFKKLSREIFPQRRVGLLHGRMRAKEKEKIMKDFTEGKLDILVATAVVEVGVDVPQATVMVIEGAERFGLAQLHQFRGRVGRGSRQSYCLLFTDAWGDKIRSRLKALIGCHDGFKLAEKDLAIRGPGEIFGIKQHGRWDLRLASLADVSLIQKSKEAAAAVLGDGLDEYPELGQKLAEFATERHLE